MKAAMFSMDQEEPKGHPQFYAFDMGHEPGDFWIHFYVRARSPAKAFKKARRIQKARGWPYMQCAALPTRRYSWKEYDRDYANPYP